MPVESYRAVGEEEMTALGARLAAGLPSPALVFLTGNLGAGKTTLIKGITAGLGAAREEDVSSPTFTLIHEYGDPVRVYHIDLYRLDEPRQLATLGLDEILDQDAVVLIEWAEKFVRWLPPPDVWIRIAIEGDARLVSLERAAARLR